MSLNGQDFSSSKRTLALTGFGVALMLVPESRSLRLVADVQVSVMESVIVGVQDSSGIALGGLDLVRPAHSRAAASLTHACTYNISAQLLVLTLFAGRLRLLAPTSRFLRWVER